MTDLLVRHAGRLLTMPGVVTDAAVVVRAGRVAWTGPEADLATTPGEHLPEYDAAGACVVPGFVDAHTHLPWAGTRRDDFVGRLSGEPYRPGGIHSTVRQTRAATDVELASVTTTRAWELLRHGTTTAEAKTGYGLSVEQELRLLDVLDEVARTTPLRLERTYLGAHTVPPGRDRDGYVDEVVTTLPAAKAHGAAWCDVFCDEGAFTVAEARRILSAARDAGLGTRIHADQIASLGGCAVAAETGCASADHLDRVDAAGATALAAAGVVATLLPVCALTLRSGWDAARVLRDAGATLALGTDCNPGTSWCESMPYVIQLACLAYGLTVDEAMTAATRGSAQALRRNDIGHLGRGAYGDLAVLDAEHEADLVAHLGARPVLATFVGGRLAQ